MVEAPPRFDLLVRGGRLIDPAAGLEGVFDVGMSGGRVTALGPTLPVEGARRVIDATGSYVTPGLVDLHTHAFHGGTFWGIEPAALAWRSGVTTWVDAGSAGALTLGAFRALVLDRPGPRVQALLNLSSIGLASRTGELADLDLCDVELCVRQFQLNRDVLRGLKVRIDRFTVGRHGLEPLRRARRAAGELGVALMVHVGHGPPELGDVLELMRAGDVLTHCTTGASMRLVDARGVLLPVARAAAERGVVFDVGHGAGAFSWASAAGLIAAGHAPQVISSDVHQLSAFGPMFDLPTCMSKCLALGMELGEVVRAATARPAELLGLAREIGTLRSGARADLAVFGLEPGPLPLLDVDLQERMADALLVNRLTVLGGEVLEPRPGPRPAPWVALSERQRKWVEGGGPDRREPGARSLSRPQDYRPAVVEPWQVDPDRLAHPRPGGAL